MKRFLSILLFAFLIGSSAMAYDFSAVCSSGQTLYYTITSSTEPYTVQVVPENATSPYYSTYPTGDLVIPTSVTNSGKTYSVTSIGAYAFNSCSGITSVTIPNTILNIGYIAFAGCSGLTTVNFNATNCTTMGSSSYPVFSNCTVLETLTIGENVTNIPFYAFSGCSGLTSVTIGNSVTSIGVCAFEGCSGLTSITIPNSVTSIGVDAFYACNGLTEVTIPSSVESIGSNAFGSCTNITTLNFNATNCTYMGNYYNPAFWGCSAMRTINIGDNVINIPAYAFKGNSLLSSITIPNSVTSIGASAFSDCSGLTSITIPNSVTSIGVSLFYNCVELEVIIVESENPVYDSRDNCNAIIETATNILIAGCKNTIIPNSVTSIGSSAFYGCSGLEEITIPNSVTSIGTYAFSRCSGLTSVTIPNSVTEIGMYAFAWSGLTDVAIPNYVTSISECVFSECSRLTTVTIGNSVERIDDGSFYHCFSLTVINFNAINCTFISNNGISGNTYITTLNIGENVTNIPDYAFAGCSGLTEVTIPNSVTSIGLSTFSSCSGLTEVTIPESVSSIGNCVFKNCTGLTTVNFNATNCTSMGTSAFSGCSTLQTINIGSNVTNIPAYAFDGCSGLIEVTIPESVASIGNSAFQNCTGLTTLNFNATNCTSMGISTYPVFSGCTALQTLNIDSNVTNIPNNAFYGCSGLKTVNFNATNCTSIGYDVWSGCSSLSTLNIGSSVTNIPDYAFAYRNGLTSVTIPNSVTSIGSEAFKGCSGLTSVTIGNSVTSIGNYAFENCTGLTSVIIPNSVTSIGEWAFSGCSGLTSVTIPNSVTSIGDYTFMNCRGLTSVTIPNSVTSIGRYAFGNCSGLTSVTIGNSVTSIGSHAFQLCSGLTSVNFNATNCTTMGSSSYPVFSYCTSLSTLNIGENVTNIPNYAFKDCSGLTSVYYAGDIAQWCGITFGNYNAQPLSYAHNLYINGSLVTNLVIPNTVTEIKAYAFRGASCLTSITIPNSVTSIGEYAFSDCSGLETVNFNATNCTTMGSSSYPVFSNCTSLSTLNIGENVTKIPDRAFNGCSGLTTVNFNAVNCTTFESNNGISGNTNITTLNIGENVTNIPANAFYNCSNIANVSLPSAVTNIGASAFYNCNHITSITIPNAVTSIGNSAFQNCTGITSVNYNATNCTSMGSSSYPVFGSCNANATISIGANVTRIPAYAFNGLRGSGTLSIPETVTSIGDYAFSACSGISTANLPNALQSIPAGLFYECSGLRSVNIPTSTSSIGNNAFYGCTNLNGSIAIPNSVTSIGANAFYNCNAISSLSIGSAVSSIGSNAFYNCSGLTSITVDASNTTYDSRDNCNAIIRKSNNQLLLGCNNTVIPESVRSIGSSAFYNCSALRSVTIPQNLISIANDVFYGCSSISEVIFNATQLNSNYTQSPFSAAQTSLKKISLGETVTRIPDYMFAGCTAIDSIVAGTTVPPTIYSSTFDYNHVSSARVLVPCRTADTYNDADFWYNFRRIREVGPCPTIYTVTALSNNNLFGTVTGGGEYEENSTATLSATPNYGYRFTAWNDGNEENPRTISVTNDVTYIATFVEIPPVATYTITALSSNPAVGVVTGGGTYYEGTEVTLTANPNEGYAFVSWNDGETLNPRQITVSGDAMYIASFIVASVVTDYEVSVASSNLAYGSVSGSGTYSLGNVVTISATAFDGYMFTSWNDGNTENPRDITVIGDAMYVANFAVIPPTPVYTLTVLSINNAYGSVSGGGEYEENAVATLTATANDGYEFTSWSDGSTDNPHEMTVTRNAMYVAYFDELPQTPTYNITVIASNPNHGSVTGGGVYEANAEVTLTATAFEGYRFDVWSDGSTDNPRNITVTSDAMYVANFLEIPEIPVYTLTVLSINNAYGSVSGGGEYEENAVATLTATANDGYEFSSWSDGSTDNPHEVTVTRNAMYVAYFDELPQVPIYNITVITSNPNHGSVTGGGVYEANAEVTLTATAFEGYRFDVWSDGSTDSIRTITVTSDAIYIANFVRNEEPQTIYNTITANACDSYTWNDITYTESGEYIQTFTATSSADSVVRLELTIYQHPEPVITVDGILDACNPETASVTLSAGEYSSYLWTTDETSETIVVSTPGYYFVEVVDSFGCHGNSEGVIIGYSTVLTEAPKVRNLGMNINGFISFSWTAPQTEGIAGYEIYREDNTMNVFRHISSVGRNKKSITDSTVNPSERAYRYMVCAVDECGGMSPMSEPHKSVHLTINQGVDNSWNLIWSHYEGFELSSYKIYRGRTTNDMVVLDTVPSNLNSYTDYSNPYNEGFFYKVMIVKNTRSRSNDEEEEDDEMLSSNIVDNGYIVMRTVMAAASNPAFGTVSGGGVYADGTEIVIEAIANEGYEFATWNDGSTDNPRSVTITSDTLFIANFVEIQQVATYTITVYSSNQAYGTVTGNGTYAEGTEITITATANSGYEFVSWSDGNSDNPRTLIVTNDAMYIATFVEASSIASYTVTVISANLTQGYVTGGGTYPEGTVISIEAIANEGYEFVSWNDNNTENPRQIRVTSDVTYVASFITEASIPETATLEISIFPNPTSDFLNITSSEEISEIEIVNVMGQIVSRKDVNSDSAVCDVAGLPSGVYVVRIRTHSLQRTEPVEVSGADETEMQRKFIKE